MTTTTVVVNMRKQKHDVKIDRSTKYGNPYHIGADGDRAEVLRKYRAYLLQNPDLVEDAKRELIGKRLGCWCKPLDCHGDILIEFMGEI